MLTRRWTFRKHIALSAVVTMISAMSHYIYQWLILVLTVQLLGDGIEVLDETAASIAIIGGADGPTALYTAMPLLLRNPAVEYIFFFLVMLLLYIPIKKALNLAFRA